MRKLFTIWTITLLCVTASAQAQQTSRWEFGVLADYGRDWYHKDYPPEVNPEWVISDFSTKRAWGAGVYFERLLSPRWSVLGQVSYGQKSVHPQLFHEYNQTGSQYYIRELHHRIAADAGVRLYLNPASQFRFFVEGKAGGNVFISAVQRENSQGDRAIKDVFGYQRIVPVASGSVGFKWSRLTVSA